MDERFSARFDARERVYDYLLLNRGSPSALWRARAWHVPRPLDDARFVAASRPLLGEHDFVTFCGELPERGGTVRDLRDITLTRRDDLVRITVRGNAFLHRMVRVVMGTLVACATGDRDVDFARRALEARDRTARRRDGTRARALPRRRALRRLRLVPAGGGRAVSKPLYAWLPWLRGASDPAISG